MRHWTAYHRAQLTTLLWACRCPEHGFVDSTSPSHDKADICAVWDALCYGLPPPLTLKSPSSSAVNGESSRCWFQCSWVQSSPLTHLFTRVI